MKIVAEFPRVRRFRPLLRIPLSIFNRKTRLPRYLKQQWRGGTRPELFSVAYGPDCELSDGPGQPSADVG